jgi:hypothetical protein
MRALVYSRENLASLPEGEFRNPRFFSGPEEGVDTVFVGPEWPRIAEAYAGAGVDVRPLSVGAAPALADAPEAQSVVIPADWETLPFTQRRGEDGLSLKGLAASLTDDPIRNKDDALAAIRAAIARAED